jgi:hypothetical protein
VREEIYKNNQNNEQVKINEQNFLFKIIKVNNDLVYQKVMSR